MKVAIITTAAAPIEMPAIQPVSHPPPPPLPDFALFAFVRSTAGLLLLLLLEESISVPSVTQFDATATVPPPAVTVVGTGIAPFATSGASEIADQPTVGGKSWSVTEVAQY